MDIFILLLLFPFSLYLIFFFFFFFLRKPASVAGNPKNLPPGSNGWPVLGENVELAFSGIEKFVSDRMARYSPDIFRTSLLGETMMVFCGLQGNKLVFSSEDKLMTPWMAPSTKKVLSPHFEKGSYKDHVARFRAYQNDSLQPEALRKYTPVMDAVARHHLRRHWLPNSVVKALPLIHRYTFELSCKLFLNVVDEERMKKLWDPFEAVRNGILRLPLDLPGTAYNRGIKAGNRLRWEMARIVEARRKELVGEPDRDRDRDRDMLSRVLLLRDDGVNSSDEEIGNFFVGMLMASHDTTATALVSLVYYLAQLPEVYREVLKEQMAIAKSKGPGENLTWQDTENMKYSWNVARESLRLSPPGPGAFREATTDFSYAGFTIYEGMKAFWTPHSTHKNPNYFPEPEKFDPSRFEGRGPEPYTFVPFGGGARICPGRVYAKVVLLVFMHNLVTSFRFEKAVPNEKLPSTDFAPKPTHGLRLRLYPH